MIMFQQVIRTTLFLLSTAVTAVAAQDVLTPNPSARKYTCSSTNKPPGLKLSALSDDQGQGLVKYLLVPAIEADGQLCTITRSNRDYGERVYIPIAKSYRPPLHPNNAEWYVSAGRYQEHTSIQCGVTNTSGPLNYVTNANEWNVNEKLCQLTLPPLGFTDDGYYMSMFTLKEYYDALTKGGSTGDPVLASRFLLRTTWGPSELYIYIYMSVYLRGYRQCSGILWMGIIVGG